MLRVPQLFRSFAQATLAMQAGSVRQEGTLLLQKSELQPARLVLCRPLDTSAIELRAKSPVA
jgi:hypothetical protein